MSSNYPKLKFFHVVARDTHTNKVEATTRLKVSDTRQAKDEFESLCRQAQHLGAFDRSSRNTLTGKKIGPLRIELYVGRPSARHSKRLIAMAGHFGAPKITDCMGKVFPSMGARLTDDEYFYRRRALEQVQAGLPIEDILPGGKDHDKSVAEEIGYLGLLNDPANDLGPELRQRWSESLSGALIGGASSLRQQMMAGHVTQNPVESSDEVRKALTEGKEGPAPKRTGPIRIMSEPEYRPGTPGLLSPEVVDELMKMSEPQHPAGLDRVLMAPLTPGELNVIQTTGRQQRNLDLVNRVLAPVGVIFKTVDKEKSTKEHVDKIRDFAYPMWLRQRDRDVEIARDHASNHAGL